MRPMPRPDADPFFDGIGPLLDFDALEAPRRLSRDDSRAVCGPDWSRIHPTSDEGPDND